MKLPKGVEFDLSEFTRIVARVVELNDELKHIKESAREFCEAHCSRSHPLGRPVHHEGCPVWLVES